MQKTGGEIRIAEIFTLFDKFLLICYTLNMSETKELTEKQKETLIKVLNDIHRKKDVKLIWRIIILSFFGLGVSSILVVVDLLT